MPASDDAPRRPPGARPLGLIEQLGAAVVALEADGRVAVANGAAARLLGRSRDDLIGRPAAELLPARLRLVENGVHAFELDEGGPAVRDDGAIAAARPGGEEFPVEVRVTPGPGEQRLVLLRDISERVQAQDALRQGPARLDEDGPDARVGSWEWDIPANAVRWSDQLYRIYGLQPGSVVPTYERFLAYVHPDDRASVDARNHKAFADHLPFQDVKRVVRADGIEILMRTQGEVICDASGAPVRMIGVCEDVTDHERDSAVLAGIA